MDAVRVPVDIFPFVRRELRVAVEIREAVAPGRLHDTAVPFRDIIRRPQDDIADLVGGTHVLAVLLVLLLLRVR